MNNLVMNNLEITSHIGDIRNAMRMKIEDIAAETGYGLERIKEIENGGEATLAETRDIALAMCTGTHCVRGDNFFSAQFSVLDYLLSNDKKKVGGSGFWGHIGILPAGSDKHLWFPISADTHEKICSRGKGEKRILLPCMNDKVLLLNMDNIKEMILLDEGVDCPDYADWDAAVNCGDIPPVLYEALDDFILCEEDSSLGDRSTMSDKFYNVMKRVAKEENWNAETVDQMKRIITHYRDGHEISARAKFYRESSLIAEISMLYGFGADMDSDDIVAFRDLGGAEISVNLNEVSMVELPLSDAEEAILRLFRGDE